MKLRINLLLLLVVVIYCTPGRALLVYLSRRKKHRFEKKREKGQEKGLDEKNSTNFTRKQRNEVSLGLKNGTASRRRERQRIFYASYVNI